MPSIPLDPLFEDERFIKASSAVRIALVSLIYHVFKTRKFDITKRKDFLNFCNLDVNTWHKHKNTILDIYHDVLPLIFGLKKRNVEKYGPQAKAMQLKCRARKEQKALEAKARNKAPIENQKSSDAAQLKRKRIT